MNISTSIESTYQSIVDFCHNPKDGTLNIERVALVAFATFAVIQPVCLVLKFSLVFALKASLIGIKATAVAAIAYGSMLLFAELLRSL